LERFDRTVSGGVLVRVHQEDLCQAMSVLPARKYQSDGGLSPGRIAELIRSAVPGSAAEIDMWRFADALLFNWLIAGTDAHARNYGLLLSGAQVRLAPLYDIASFLPYDDSNGHKLKLAMKMGGEYKLSRTDRRRAWERAADELKLGQSRLIERGLDLAARTPDAFALAVERAVERGVESDVLGRLVELVARRCKRCSAVLN
jgi:serine/threonine-protein kinase HipA